MTPRQVLRSMPRSEVIGMGLFILALFVGAAVWVIVP